MGYFDMLEAHCVVGDTISHGDICLVMVILISIPPQLFDAKKTRRYRPLLLSHSEKTSKFKEEEKSKRKKITAIGKSKKKRTQQS
jgi:hypothetical protein